MHLSLCSEIRDILHANKGQFAIPFDYQAAAAVRVTRKELFNSPMCFIRPFSQSTNRITRSHVLTDYEIYLQFAQTHVTDEALWVDCIENIRDFLVNYADKILLNYRIFDIKVEPVFSEVLLSQNAVMASGILLTVKQVGI